MTAISAVSSLFQEACIHHTNIAKIRTSIAFALAAATGFSVAQVTAKRGVLGASVTTGLFYSTLAGWLVSLVAVAVRPPAELSLSGVAFFVLAGLLTAGVGRMFSIMGIDRLGASRHAPIQNSVSPTVSVIAGILVFAESTGILKIAGLAAIIVGVWNVSRGRSKEGLITRSTPLAALTFSVASGLSIATGDVLRKQGLSILDAPELALMIGMTAALLIWSAVRRSTRRKREENPDRRALAWFAASGTAASGAQLALLHALNVGDLSVVSPITNTQPLLVLLLSAVMLRGVERLDGRVVVGALLTVTGVIAISLSA